MANGRINVGSGKKSLILPTAPIITISTDDKTLDISWTQPESEVEISKYGVYYSMTQPSSLRDMILHGRTTSLTYTITGLTNDQTYYIAVESVSVDGYENATMWEVKDGVPTVVRFICVGNGGYSYYSTNGTSWVAMSGLSSASYYNGATYGNGRFICVGNYWCCWQN